MKELIEGVSGVPAATQRLLARGRVLADEASMESARIEDGDTLLLVTAAPEGRANAELARDPHAPENAEGTGNGGNAGLIGDLSQMITSLLTSNPAALGIMGGGSGALTVEFSIGGPPFAARQAGQREATAAAGQQEQTEGATATATAAVEVDPQEALRRYVANVESLINRMRVSSTSAVSPNVPEETVAPDASCQSVHYGVQCDACEVVPVRGSRFKSVAHDDFDLCEDCFRAGRGAQCGPFTRLDLPLPAGLPPVIASANADDPDENQVTPRQESEASVAALGSLLQTASQLARDAGPLIENIANRFHPESRENTVETQAQSLQLATLMHSVGALWCELARCIAVVPPPPNAMTPEGAAFAGDDINGARSVFNYPQASYITSNGAFAHTRPPGMPRHDQEAGYDRSLTGRPPPFPWMSPNTPTRGGMMHVLHRQLSGQDAMQDLNNLPPELRSMLLRQARTAQTAQTASQTRAGSQAPADSAHRTTTSTPGNEASRRQAQARSSQRALGRFLGSVLRAIPSPSFLAHAGPNADGSNASGTSAATAGTSAPNASRGSLIQDMYSQIVGSPPRQQRAPQENANTAPPSASSPADDVLPSAQDDVPTRSRMRNESKEGDENHRAAKASNTGNGLSPAASAAHLAKDDPTKSTLGQASTSRAGRDSKMDLDESDLD